MTATATPARRTGTGCQLQFVRYAFRCAAQQAEMTGSRLEVMPAFAWPLSPGRGMPLCGVNYRPLGSMGRPVNAQSVARANLQS